MIRCVSADTSEVPGSSGPERSRGITAIGPIASLIPQRPTIWRAIRELLEVGLGARRQVAVDEPLRGAAAQRDLDPPSR